MSPYRTDERDPGGAPEESTRRRDGGASGPLVDGRSWAMGCHLAGLAKWTVIPFAGRILPLVLLFDVVCSGIAAVQANKGQPYRYPLTIRFLG